MVSLIVTDWFSFKLLIVAALTRGVIDAIYSVTEKWKLGWVMIAVVNHSASSFMFSLPKSLWFFLFICEDRTTDLVWIQIYAFYKLLFYSH